MCPTDEVVVNKLGALENKAQRNNYPFPKKIVYIYILKYNKKY